MQAIRLSVSEDRDDYGYEKVTYLSAEYLIVDL